MESNELEQKVLELVNRPGYQPVKPKVIAKKLGLAKEQQRALKQVIKNLVKTGKLSYGSSHVVKRPEADSRGRLTGIFRRASGGFGFVRPQAATTVSDKSDDIFIPANSTKDAADGDMVLVRLRGRRGGGDRRQSGEILEVIERDTHQFVGVYYEERAQGLVQIDGGVFTNPVPVGDAGAKSAQPGDKVVVEMVRFPSHWQDGEGVIVEILGKRGAPGVDTLAIIREFNLPGDFPEEVLENAREQAEAFGESLAGRLDLRELTVITIDPEDARDFDDAISLEQIDKGHWRLGVHIADVSHFVPPGCPLDKEARDRATSVYLPDRVIPMLPEIISNNLASLQPERVRYTKSLFIEFTPDGARVGVDPHSAAIQSDRRFTYEEVDDYLAKPKKWEKKLEGHVHALLGRMHTLAMILRQRRFERGALELTMREVEIDLDKDGRVSGAHVRENTESHQIIEEFMLAANEAVAELLDDREIFFLRRIHLSPDPRKLKDLTEFVRELGVASGSLEDRFETQRLLKDIAGEPYERAINYAVLRSMQKAVYGPEEEGHYALASDNYCHFTSPIRRYPDLTVHRLLEAIIEGRPPVSDFDALVVAGQHCSDREQRAEAAERELIKVKLLYYLSDSIGQQMEAVITGVQNFGLFAQGVEIPAEGLIHVSSMVDDYYHYEATTHTLSGAKQGNVYRLGDLVQVEVAHVDVDRRELDFRLLGLIRHAPQGGRKRSGKRETASSPSKSSPPKKGRGKKTSKKRDPASGKSDSKRGRNTTKKKTTAPKKSAGGKRKKQRKKS